MYTSQNFERLLGTEGFSDELLKDHFTLYEGYVKNTNSLLEKLAGADLATPEGAEMKRHFGWEWNGMRMHELYFENMAKGGVKIGDDSRFVKLANDSFGSAQKAHEDFVATGKMRGIGWVVMSYDHASKKLVNLWVNEHDVGHLVGTTPILVMDCFEHAYIRDYGIKRPEYIEAFIKAIDWSVVDGRIPKI